MDTVSSSPASFLDDYLATTPTASATAKIRWNKHYHDSIDAVPPRSCSPPMACNDETLSLVYKVDVHPTRLTVDSMITNGGGGQLQHQLNDEQHFLINRLLAGATAFDVDHAAEDVYYDAGDGDYDGGANDDVLSHTGGRINSTLDRIATTLTTVPPFLIPRKHSSMLLMCTCNK